MLADGDEKELLIAMRQLTLAFGGVADVAKLAKLHPKTLYRTLSKDGNPEVYGKALPGHVPPTAIGVMALQDRVSEPLVGSTQLKAPLVQDQACSDESWRAYGF